MDTYLTIKNPSEGYYTEKRSKFLAFAFPVSNVEEIKQKVTEFQKKYYDARHVCYAYMIGPERTTFRANDNGEPSGTAGKPILGQINSNNLTDILIIVVRYFGGVKLGTGGLVRAYGSSVSQALDQARLCQVKRLQVYSLEFGYEWIGKIDALLRNHNIEITLKNYEETVQYQYTTSLDISEEIKEISAGSIVPVYVTDTEMEVEIERKEG